MFKKGQSAAEYLIGYGIVLLILIAVIGILYYFFSRQRPVTPSCEFPIDFYCFDFNFNSSGLTLDIGHSTGHPIVITGINCTQQDNSAGILNTSIRVQINDGEHKRLPAITCYGINGEPKYGSIGTYYNGKIYLRYNESDTMVPHLLTGVIVAKYE